MYLADARKEGGAAAPPASPEEPGEGEDPGSEDGEDGEDGEGHPGPELDDEGPDDEGAGAEADGGRAQLYGASWPKQLWHVYGRQLKIVMRNRGPLYISLAQGIFFAVLVGLIFSDMGKDYQGIQVSTATTLDEARGRCARGGRGRVDLTRARARPSHSDPPRTAPASSSSRSSARPSAAPSWR